MLKNQVLFNMGMMIFAWSCVSFSYFLLNFYIKYIPGNIYENQMVSGLACFAFLISGPISKKVNNKHILTGSFVMALFCSLILFSISMIFAEVASTDGIAIIILMIRCGINLAFCMVFVIHTELFPTCFLASSYGICNFVCRSVTLAAPLIAEAENRAIPMMALILASMVGSICSANLRKIKQECEDESLDDSLNKSNISVLKWLFQVIHPM